MDVLVIGGTGTISRAIVQALLRRGHAVTLFNRGLRADQPPSEVRLLQGDRRDRPTFEAALQTQRFDVAIDMISFTAEDAASALRALRGRVGHFVHCSTVMTYGPPFTALYQDETAPLNGQHDGGYGAGKVAADALLLSAYRDEDFPATIVKPSFTYGPGGTLLRQADLSSNWIDRLRKGQPLLSVGDGLNYFQFLPAPDAGAAFADLAGNPASLGQTYNLVHPEPLTWDAWLQAVAAALGVQAEIVHAPQDLLLAISDERYGHLPGNFGHTQVFSGARLASLLPDWRPRTPQREAIAATIAWMDQAGQIAASAADPLEDRIIQAIRALPDQSRLIS
ncbi:MAG: NAD-dependent epimerase/dehydratase family protein [Herpetosiphonaceae bacterium]|nr:NAD-dependent epimerase/dehydratase family protein [Herpetosiphonaceae bacterium]